jgi:predicted Rossmann-fold nucleotide-binding protein
LNVNGFFDPLLVFLDRLESAEFIAPEHRKMVLVDQTAAGLLAQFQTYAPPNISKAQRALAQNQTE